MKGFVSSRLHPLANLGLLLILLLATFCVACLVLVICTYLFFGVGLLELGNVTQHPADHPYGWAILMLCQGVLLLGGFGGAAVAFAALTGSSLPEYFAPRRPAPLVWLFLAAVLIIASLPAMSVLISWNAKVHLPGLLHGLEQSARESEDKAAVLTRFLTRFSSPLRFWIGVLVIAVVPAMCEELFFRGVLQRNLVQWLGRHAGIWLAAALFSAAHNQFFGFVPRFVLGLGLGYLYEWSGNILVPMAAHFTQNAFQLTLLYLQQRDWSASDFDPDSTDALPWYWVLLSVVLCTAGLWYLHRLMSAPRADAPPTQMHTLGSHGVAVRSPEAPATTGRTLNHEGVDATNFNG